MSNEVATISPMQYRFSRTLLRFLNFLPSSRVLYLSFYLTITFLLSMIPLFLTSAVAETVVNYMTVSLAISCVIIVLVSLYTSKNTEFYKPLSFAALFLGAFATAETINSSYILVWGTEGPFPSIADLIWIMGYIPLAIMLTQIIRRFDDFIQPNQYLATFFGTLIGTILILVPLSMTTVKIGEDESLLGLAVLIAYPSLDMVIVALCVFVIIIFRKSLIRYHWFLIILGILVFTAGDILFALFESFGIYFSGSIPDVLFLYSYFLFAGAFMLVLLDASNFKKLSPMAAFELEQVYITLPDGRVLYSDTRTLRRISQGQGTDQDILGSMLVALQHFVQDSFSQLNPSKIKTLFFGNFEIAVEYGNFLTIMFVLRGKATQDLRKRAKEALKSIEERYDVWLEHWSGNQAELKPIKQIGSFYFSEFLLDKNIN